MPPPSCFRTQILPSSYRPVDVKTCSWQIVVVRKAVKPQERKCDILNEYASHAIFSHFRRSATDTLSFFSALATSSSASRSAMLHALKHLLGPIYRVSAQTLIRRGHLSASTNQYRSLLPSTVAPCSFRYPFLLPAHLCPTLYVEHHSKGDQTSGIPE